MKKLTDFYNIHKGETALMVGNGKNIYKTPPNAFDYPSFGMNTIFYYEGDWKPTYYVAVDAVVKENYGELASAIYPDVPKFIPDDIGNWKGDNFYRFKPYRAGINVASKPDILQTGLGFKNSMTAAMMLAIHMGFTRLLMIGVEQKAGDLVRHFWGDDPQMPRSQTDEHWNIGYKDIQTGHSWVEVLNISVDTYVPEDVLKRDDWRKYATG